MTDYEKNTALRALRLVLLLTHMADERGYTHGEKHHFHQVTIHALTEAIADLTGRQLPLSDDITELTANDIPF